MTAGSLRFLADESCDRAVIAALREDGYDVFAVSEVMTRSIDSDLMRQAVTQRHILLTEDKDFGALVFVTHMDSSGVILMRFPAIARQSLVDSVRHAVREHDDAPIDTFNVIQPGLVRQNRRSPR
jgi:predicted nuclease of predicted toxin-antitoxin system